MVIEREEVNEAKNNRLDIYVFVFKSLKSMLRRDQKVWTGSKLIYLGTLFKQEPHGGIQRLISFYRRKNTSLADFVFLLLYEKSGTINAEL